MHNHDSLVLNWHITGKCNYHCQYCYAAWDGSTHGGELIHDQERTGLFLKELHQFFRPENRKNYLADFMTWRKVRLNLAGGEPLLYAGKIPSIVAQARRLGFQVSLISNGSYLSDALLQQLGSQLAWLGISIDSANPETNEAIGRVDSRGQLLDLEKLMSSLAQVRRAVPGLRIKINTVVNRLNHSGNLGPLIQRLAPDRWKVLRMLPVTSPDLAVTDEQFAAFVTRHRALSRILRAEDNHDMRESYLMIDPCGRFFQNSQLGVGEGYVYSRSILEVGADAAFADIVFDHERFNTRYTPVDAGVCA